MVPGSETSPVAAAWVPLSDEGDDVEVKRFALPITGSHLLVRLCLLSSPLDIPLPSGLRVRPMSIRQRRQGVPHHPPDCFAILMPKAKLILESICERTQGMPQHRPASMRIVQMRLLDRRCVKTGSARSKSGSIRTWRSSARGAGPRASRRSLSRRSRSSGRIAGAYAATRPGPGHMYGSGDRRHALP